MFIDSDIEFQAMDVIRLLGHQELVVGGTYAKKELQWNLIKDFYRHMGCDYAHLMPKIIDTLSIARGVKSGLRFKPDEPFLAYQYRMASFRQKGLKARLVALGKEYEIKHDYHNLHDALTDLKLNVKIWNKLKWQIDI